MTTPGEGGPEVPTPAPLAPPSDRSIVTATKGQRSFQIAMASGSVAEAARGMRRFGWDVAVRRVGEEDPGSPGRPAPPG